MLDALRWNFGLASTLYGRDEDLAGIRAWAEAKPLLPSARLITGEGGAGKTRLAAEAAKRMHALGWKAGFLRQGVSLRVAIGQAKGLLLILDYPEESPDLARSLFEAFGASERSAFPIRLLLLSRRDFAHWEDAAMPLQGRFGRHPVAAPDALAEDQALALIGEAASAFAGRAGQPLPNLERAPEWLAAQPLHRLPLLAIAAAIHAVLAPEAAFGIEGGAIIRDLAERERRRVQRISENLGIGPATLERLLALGILADGLDAARIKALAEAGIGEGTDGTRLLAAIDDTPWWRAGRLIRLQPDRVAASFLDASLFAPNHPDGDESLPHWLSIALKGSERDFGDRLGRVLYDLDAPGVARNGAAPLESALIAMIEREPGRVVDFAPVAEGKVPYAAAGFAAAVAQILAGGLKEHPELAVSFLNNAANYLSLLGRREEAFEAAKEAVDIGRALAKARPDTFTPDLASSLNNFGTMLSYLGRREAALEAAKEAVEIRRALAKARPDTFTPDLAGSLNNLGAMLSELGRHEEASEAAQEATEFYRALTKARPDTFTPDLAMSLNNLGNILSELGRHEAALEAAQEAIEIRRALAKARPDTFTPDLALSLNNLGNMLSKLDCREAALAAAMESFKLFGALAAKHPAAFAQSLFIAMRNLAERLSALGREEEADSVRRGISEIFGSEEA